MVKAAWRYALALFPIKRRAAQRSVLIGDVAIALVGVTQRGVAPMVFAVIAGGGKDTSLQLHVFTGGDVRTGRQHAAGFTVQNAVDVGYAFRTAVSVLKRGG